MSKPNPKYKNAKKSKSNPKTKKAKIVKKPVKNAKTALKKAKLVKKPAKKSIIKQKSKPKAKLNILKMVKKPFKKPEKKPNLKIKAKKPVKNAKTALKKAKLVKINQNKLKNVKNVKLAKPVKPLKKAKEPKPKKLTKKELKEQEAKQKQLMLKALQQAMAASLEALLKESGVRNLLIETAGENTIAVLKELTSLGEDEKIAQKLEVKVSQVRSVLNKLHAEGIVSYERTKDDQTGWYYYNWLLNMDKLINWVQNRKEQNMKLIEESAKIEQYFCVKCGSIHGFEQAMECSFKCVNCNSNLDLLENKIKKPVA